MLDKTLLNNVLHTPEIDGNNVGKLPGFDVAPEVPVLPGLGTHDDTSMLILYKKKADVSKQEKVKDLDKIVDFGHCDPNHEFDPSKKGNHDSVYRHKKYGKFYQDINDPSIYYSKALGGDRAHSGPHWKKFKLHGKIMHKVGAIDMCGNEIPRHQSDDKFKYKELIGIK